MVKVGRFWVDRYESVLVDSKTYNGGTCDGAGGKCGASATGQCGAGIVDDYPSTFPDSGNWTSPVYACSKKGAVPSRMMTWFQAQQACLLSNKRLCTIGEWQGASAGTYDAGKYNGAAGGACHTGGTALRKTGLAGKTPGASSSCISLWGAEDMNGNLQEYADRWGQAGTHWATSDVHFATPWSAAKGYGEGGDRTWNVNGRASNGASWVAGAPAVAILGGYFMSGAAAGAVALNMNSSPSGWHLANGSRCCRD